VVLKIQAVTTFSLRYVSSIYADSQSHLHFGTIMTSRLP